MKIGAPTSRATAGADESAGAGSGARPDLWIRPFSPEKTSLNNGGANSLVLVMPEALKKEELVDTRHFLRFTRLPLLGLVTYSPSSRWKRRAGRRSQRVNAQIGNQL